jgi:hypothetical protein
MSSSRVSFLLPVISVAAIFFFVASSCLAQAQQDSKIEKKEQNPPAPPATTSPPPASQKPASLKEAVQKKKVLTEDDLNPDLGRKSTLDSDLREFNPICNPRCEQMVRDRMMSDSDSELEFRNKLAFASKQIDEDSKWGNAVVAGVHAADAYCDLERNRGKYAYPGAQPPYTTDKLNFAFISKEREVWDKYTFAKSDLEILLRNVRPLDPFRAVVMESQWAVALARSCSGVDRL